MTWPLITRARHEREMAALQQRCTDQRIGDWQLAADLACTRANVAEDILSRQAASDVASFSQPLSVTEADAKAVEAARKKEAER